MKRFFLVLAFVAMACTAQAWTKVVDNASFLIAEKYMTESTKAEYNRILALKEMVDYKWVADKEMKVSLDADLCSTTTCENDIVVRMERAIEVLRNREKYSDAEQYKALLNLRKLNIELHTISRVVIDGVEHSQQDFEFTWSSNREGPSPDKIDKYEKRGKLTWHKLWSSNFCFWHQAWSSEYYAYDINLRFSKLSGSAMQGTVRDWAHEMGLRAKPMYEWAKPGMLLRNEPRLNLEDIHLEMVARSAYRLAAILNDNLK
jgi:hypothetical protein